MQRRKIAGKTNTRYFRIVDANLNRCREGMRVIEDTARFVLGKDGIYRAIRCQRHRIDALLRPLYPELLRTRDTDTDAGRVIKEGGRGNLAAVVAANFKRVEESLRVLEEYTKFLAPDKSPGIKKIRFSMYRMEKNFDA